MTFDHENETMKSYKIINKLYMIVYLIATIFQLLMLGYKGVGLFTFWVFVEYSQLVAFIPLHTSRYLPYVYGTFKPFLLTHFLS